MKFLFILWVLFSSSICLPQSGVVNSSLNYSIGDTKLSFQPLNPNNPTWIYANGATVYPSIYSTLYPLLGSTELGTATQTVPPVTQSTNGYFGLSSIWLPDGTFLTSQRETAGTLIPKAYILPWNNSTKTLGTPNLVNNSIYGAVLGDASQISAANYPYYAITGSNNFRILKWNGSSLQFMQSFAVGTNFSIVTSFIKDSITNDYYFLYKSGGGLGTLNIYKKPNGSETWSNTGRTISVSSTVSSIPSVIATYYMISNDFLVLMAYSPSIGFNSAVEIYKLNTVSNVYESFQLICSGGASINQCAPPLNTHDNSISPQENDFFVLLSGQLCGYRYNGTTFSQVYCHSSQVSGITITGFSLLSAKLAKYDHPLYDETYAYLLNFASSVYSHRIGKYNPSTMQFSTVSTTALSGYNITSSNIVFLDGRGIMTFAQGTNFGGGLQSIPLRKTLPTLADPATGLKYQIKAR